MKHVKLDRNKIYTIGSKKFPILKIINKKNNKTIRSFELIRIICRRKNKLYIWAEEDKLTFTFKNIKSAIITQKRIKEMLK